MNWNPLVAFTNMGGDISFTKLLVCFFCFAVWKEHAPNGFVMTLLIAAAFGKSTFEAWLQRGTWTASDATINNTETRITLTGEPGVQPAP